MAARDSPAAGARVQGNGHGAHGRRQAQGLGLRRDRRRRHDGRRRHTQGGRRRPQHRTARRHGRAADRRTDGTPLREQERRRHARVRPRRPHDHAARRRAAPRPHEEFLGHPPADLPAGRGERDRLRREADAGRRALRALSVRCHLRHAQPSRQAGADVSLSQRAFHVGVRPRDDHREGRRRPRRASPPGDRSHRGRFEHRHGACRPSSRETSTRRR